MSAVHVHLLLNHVPILGSFFGLALLAWGLVRRSDEVVRAAWLTWALSGLCVLPVFFSGEPAEDAVLGRPDVSEMFVERHEDAAKRALVASLALAALSLGALAAARGERRPSRPWTLATLVAGLVAAILLTVAGGLGGQIRHAELRPGAQLGGEDRGRADDDHR